MRRFLGKLFRSRVAFVAALILAFVVLLAVVGPYVTPHDPNRFNVLARFTPPAWMERGTPEHLLGTDSLGRDTFSRLILGARVSLIVGLAAVAIGGLIGTTMGLIAGYFGGRTDAIVMRLVDIQLAFPGILLALTVLALLGRSLGNLILVLGIVQWAQYARLVRGYVLSLREQEFVEGATALGARAARVIVRHILPNSTAPIIVIASFSVATTILAESALSFLGLGVPPTVPTWGGMLSEGRDYLVRAWWLATFPGLAITATVLSINLLGDWLRDYLDPNLKEVV
jgi:peptide/nickel transport system permease protein